MHAGDKPYVVAPSGQIELASRGLTLDAVNGIVSQLLPPDALSSLDEFGAIQQELAALAEFPGESFTVVAARGGDDVWVEIRRRKVSDDDQVPDDFFAATSRRGGRRCARRSSQRTRPSCSSPRTATTRTSTMWDRWATRAAWRMCGAASADGDAEGDDADRPRGPRRSRRGAAVRDACRRGGEGDAPKSWPRPSSQFRSMPPVVPPPAAEVATPRPAAPAPVESPKRRRSLHRRRRTCGAAANGGRSRRAASGRSYATGTTPCRPGAGSCRPPAAVPLVPPRRVTVRGTRLSPVAPPPAEHPWPRLCPLRRPPRRRSLHRRRVAPPVAPSVAAPKPACRRL